MAALTEILPIIKKVRKKIMAECSVALSHYICKYLSNKKFLMGFRPDLSFILLYNVIRPKKVFKSKLMKGK